MPGPVPYSDIGGGGALPPHGEDYFNRIVNVHWPKKIVGIAEQALVQRVDYGSGASSTGVALDSGENFSGVASGASGRLKSSNLWTVLSGGIVVYGQAREATQACFMACVDGNSIVRGTEGIGGESNIVWEPVYNVGGNLYALSFAGGIFFVVYAADTKSPSSCAVSVDGVNFSEIGSLYPGVPFPGGPHDEQMPGSVAYNGSSYATAGSFAFNRSFSIADNCMMWGFSEDGFSWGAGTTPDEFTNPGINASSLVIGGNSQAYTTIAGGVGRFVATAVSRNKFENFTGPGVTTTRSTGAAAVSSTGASWDTIKLPGVQEGFIDPENQGGSQTTSVAFIRTGSGGYFVITGQQNTEQPLPDGTFETWCFRGDGSTWSKVLSDSSRGTLFGTVSAVAGNLKATKIVNI